MYPGGPLTDETLLDEDSSAFRSVHYSYDDEGELTARSGSTEPATFTYNGSYKLKSMSDGNSHTTNYSYDWNGRPTPITFPGYTSGSADKVTFDEYDLIGRLLEKTDGRGQTTTYSYDDDPDGNLSDITYSSTPNAVHVEYDELDRVTEVDDSEGVATSSYDDLDMVSGATRQYTGLSSKSVTYTYYPDGSRHVMSNPAGDWTYSYDLDGRCTSMVSPAGTSTIGYADNGWVTSRVLPNGSTTDYTYNAVGMMTSLVNKKSNGSALTSFGTTSYDGAFNLTSLTSTFSSPTYFGGLTTWTYDDKDQLTNETTNRNTSGWNHTNEYDDAGNPTKFKNNTRTYNSDNQLTTGSMTYDGNGNPTTYAGATLTYDENNRVTSIGSLLTCGYRADGQRAWKQGATGGKTYFLYDQGNPVVEMNSSGTVTATNVYAPDGLVGRKEGSNAWNYYTFDMQGNVAQKLSPTESVSSGRMVDAWGTGIQTLTPWSPDCFTYNAKWGYYYDTQTGLYLCQHRMYDASTGRWLNRDPIGYSGGINLYGYCGNRAVGLADPSGFQVGEGEADPEPEPGERGGPCTENGAIVEGFAEILRGAGELMARLVELAKNGGGEVEWSPEADAPEREEGESQLEYNKRMGRAAEQDVSEALREHGYHRPRVYRNRGGEGRYYDGELPMEGAMSEFEGTYTRIFTEVKSENGVTTVRQRVLDGENAQRYRIIVLLIRVRYQ